MKIFFILKICLTLLINLTAAIGFSKEKIPDIISKESMAFYMISMCKNENWTTFYNNSKKYNLFSNDFKFPKNLKFISTEAYDEDLGVKVSWTQKSTKLQYKNKTYTGNDPCEVLSEFLNQETKTSSIVNFIISEANAEDILKKQTMKKVALSAMIGFSAIGLRLCTTTILINPVVFGACGTAFGTLLYIGIDELQNLFKVESFWNDPFKIMCDSNSVVLKGNVKKVVIHRNTNPIKIDYEFLKHRNKVESKNDQDFMSGESQQIAKYLAENCSNSADASRLNAEIEKKRSNFAAISTELKSIKPVEKETTRSGRNNSNVDLSR